MTDGLLARLDALRQQRERFASVQERYVAYCPECNEGEREIGESYDDSEAWADQHNREHHSNAAESEIADEMTRNDHK
ncbi:hypothetical protein MARTHA_44 [Arthrobacter phage Martha]|uniref:Uncharacterized protein n=1 Tax=Arthrobacter phage Martha TaxID=1772307 RepID=A0A0U4JMU7_9CAUD|nr:hypothetical protein FDH49_gp44 [Arthrobacter phage Martha]ALY09697.1 hypothetical protein MARTHA_44 [Arthrobacter phage Martha]